MKCPRCEAEVEGQFCGVCGASLEVRRCSGCDSAVPAGHRFCSQCGREQVEGTEAAASTAVQGSSRRRGGSPSAATENAPAPEPPDWETAAKAPRVTDGAPDRRAWWFLAAAVAAGALFLSVPYVWSGWADTGDDPRVPMEAGTGSPPPGAGSPSPGAAPNVDLSSMTPREAADRLFNRVMTALGEGNQSEVETFLPMAVDAYQLVSDLDADGHFHLSLLQQAGGNHREALQTAERVLSTQPDHLLALYAAGEAARELGEMDRAADHYGRILEVFETESARDLPEYQEHSGLLPTIRETSETFLEEGT